ncbi:MAG: ankyrin repeat domain-containing protein [Alphaproteobacteria bacterium]|nr:ankyrin repeat domain-containing protein [Alphaproteobacteria bacterium]
MRNAARKIAHTLGITSTLRTVKSTLFKQWLTPADQLFLAIDRGDTNTVITLLQEKRVSPNIAQITGVTPLIQATVKGQTEMVKALLDAGADPSMATKEGLIAYDFSRFKKNQEIEMMLYALKRRSHDPRHVASTNQDLQQFISASDLVLPEGGMKSIRERAIEAIGEKAWAETEAELKRTNYRSYYEEVFAPESHACANFLGDNYKSMRSAMNLGEHDVELAKRRGIDVVELFAGKYATTDALLKRLLPDSLFDTPPRRIVEIGGAWGATIKHLTERFKPEEYQNYEPDPYYANFVVERFGVKKMPTDGETLRGTADDSVDLFIANNVMIFIPPIKNWSYMTEMRRVVRKGGVILFNLVLSDVLHEGDMRRYLDMYFPKRTVQIFPRDILDRTFPAPEYTIHPVIDREYVLIKRAK